MGKAIRACALILSLACSAQAGWMSNGVAPPPPTPEPQAAEREQLAQEPAAVNPAESDATGVLAQIAFNLAANVLSLV